MNLSVAKLFLLFSVVVFAACNGGESKSAKPAADTSAVVKDTTVIDTNTTSRPIRPGN